MFSAIVHIVVDSVIYSDGVRVCVLAYLCVSVRVYVFVCVQCVIFVTWVFFVFLCVLCTCVFCVCLYHALSEIFLLLARIDISSLLLARIDISISRPPVYTDR